MWRLGTLFSYAHSAMTRPFFAGLNSRLMAHRLSAFAAKRLLRMASEKGHACRRAASRREFCHPLATAKVSGVKPEVGLAVLFRQ